MRARIQRSKAAVQVSQTAGELEKAEVEAADAELRAVLQAPPRQTRLTRAQDMAGQNGVSPANVKDGRDRPGERREPRMRPG